jgi:hypothetical protein
MSGGMPTEGDEFVGSLDRLDLLAVKLKKLLLEIVEIVKRKAAGIPLLGEGEKADLGSRGSRGLGNNIAA